MSICPTHTHTNTFEPQVTKKVPPNRGTGLRRCVYTNPHKQMTTNAESRASEENERNAHTHQRSPEKLIRTYRYVEVAANINWREKDYKCSNYKRKETAGRTRAGEKC